MSLFGLVILITMITTTNVLHLKVDPWKREIPVGNLIKFLGIIMLHFQGVPLLGANLVVTNCEGEFIWSCLKEESRSKQNHCMAPFQVIYISHQTGSSETHRLKSAAWEGIFDGSQEGYLNIYIYISGTCLFPVFGSQPLQNNARTTTIVINGFQVQYILGGDFKHFLAFSPRTLGKWSNLTKICQMGWFNHQLSVWVVYIASPYFAGFADTKLNSLKNSANVWGW